MLLWMAWTWQTGVFFGAILLTLIAMSVIAIRWPETPRVGIFRFPTTRGDRLFMSLLGWAYIFLLWIRLTGGDNLWVPLAGAVVLTALMFRFA